MTDLITTLERIDARLRAKRTTASTVCQFCGTQPNESSPHICPDRAQAHVCPWTPASAESARAKRTIVSSIRTDFCDLLTTLTDNMPPPIMGEMDADDIDELAEHMRRVMGAVEKYAEAVIADAKYRTSGLDFDVNVTGRLSDMQGDLVGAFKNAAEAMREFEREHEADDL